MTKQFAVHLFLLLIFAAIMIGLTLFLKRMDVQFVTGFAAGVAVTIVALYAASPRIRDRLER